MAEAMLLDLLDTLGYALDTPGAYTRGALAGRPGQRVGGRDLLEEWGVLGSNQDGLDFGDVAGFGAEVLLDPLNFVGGGALKAITGANKGIKAANKSSEAMRAAGAMPEEIARLTKAVDETGHPLRTYHGTPHTFDRPDFSKMDADALYGPGYYTTADPKVASEYVEKGYGAIDSARRTAEQDVEFLQRRLPQLKDMEAKGLLDDYPQRHGMTRAEKIAELEQRLARQMEAMDRHPQANVRMQYLDTRNPFDARGEGLGVLGEIKQAGFRPTETLRQRGYDSIVHRGGGIMGDVPHDVWIATDPSQIYSPYVAPALQSEHRTSPLLALLAGYNFGQAPHDLGLTGAN